MAIYKFLFNPIRSILTSKNDFKKFTRLCRFTSTAEPIGSNATNIDLDKEASSSAQHKIRDVAIIAHVDHGKTTLMDRLLRQCGADLQGDRVMDSITLEKERGITITSKYTSMVYQGTTFNVVDTPGHADFGGEVERVLGMVDGAVLLVDAGEGPLAQTKFVLSKALKRGFRPLVLLNKVDRPSVTERSIHEAENKIFDLFASLDATDEQLDFTVLYASAKEGWVSKEIRFGQTKSNESNQTNQSNNNKNSKTVNESNESEKSNESNNMIALLDTILTHVPPPFGNPHAPFQLLVCMIERDPFLGRIATGRIMSGSVKVGDRVQAIKKNEKGEAESVEEGRVVKLIKRLGMGKIFLENASVGDIVAIAGLAHVSVSHTISHLQITEALDAPPIDPPTISMTFSVNDSPLGGREGSQLTGPKIGERLKAEAETNVSINVNQTANQDAFEVQGRGELQLGVLIENMRREGFELSVSPPAVMFKEENGKKLEPIEEVIVEVDEQYAGAVIEGLSMRRAELSEMVPCSDAIGRTRLQFNAPSRGLLGYRSVLNTVAHGSALMHRSFLGYEPWRGPIDRVRKGALVSMTSGSITAYSLVSLEARGMMFISPGAETYDGMVIGEHSRDEDLEVNPVKSKELTNIRTVNKDENVRLTPPKQMSLEEAIGYVASDELIEVTPQVIRLRKKYLTSSERRAHRKSK